MTYELYENADHVLTVSASYIPALKVLRSVAPLVRTYRRYRARTPPELPGDQLSSRNQAAAWVMSGLIRRYARVPDGRIETWILAPTEHDDGRFTPLFTERSSIRRGELRLIIHCFEPRSAKGSYEMALSEAHHMARMREQWRGDQTSLQNSILEPFKRDLAVAYSIGITEVRTLMNASQHPYWFSAGL